MARFIAAITRPTDLMHTHAHAHTHASPNFERLFDQTIAELVVFLLVRGAQITYSVEYIRFNVGMLEGTYVNISSIIKHPHRRYFLATEIMQIIK